MFANIQLNFDRIHIFNKFNSFLVNNLYKQNSTDSWNQLLNFINPIKS